jgi:hypothetical protein
VLLKQKADAIPGARQDQWNRPGAQTGEAVLAAAGHQQDGVMDGTVDAVDTRLDASQHFVFAQLVRSLREEINLYVIAGLGASDLQLALKDITTDQF